MKKALIIIDLQNDFVPGGALAVQGGDQVVPVINRLLQKDFDLKIATKDWHPKDHSSFAVNQRKNPGETIELDGLQQILWPVHCVQNTHGSEFVPELKANLFEKVFYKGTDREIDSYSGFFDNGQRKATGLDDYLRERGIKELYFAGLATDYCVKYSVLDALKLGYKVFLFTDGCRAVNLQENDEKEALEAMCQAGCQLIDSSTLKETRS